MKKNLLIIASTALITFLVTAFLSYFLVPIYIGELADGGSKVYKSRLYTLVDWKQLKWIDESGINRIPDAKEGWKIYWWPNNEKY